MLGGFLVGLLVGILLGWFGTFYLRRQMDKALGYDHIKEKF